MTELKYILVQKIGVFYKNQTWKKDIFDKIAEYYRSLDMIESLTYAMWDARIVLKDGTEIETKKEVEVLDNTPPAEPVIISNYPTASSQVKNGVDGIICEMNNDSIAEEIYTLAHNINKQVEIVKYLSIHDYGNEREINKIYQLL